MSGSASRLTSFDVRDLCSLNDLTVSGLAVSVGLFISHLTLIHTHVQDRTHLGALALINDISIDTDEGRVSSNAVGAIIDHGLGFQSFVEYRELDPIDAAFLRVGARQEVTVKYALGLAGEYNVTEREFQSVSGFVTRRFPQWTVDVGIDFDSITDNVGFGISLRPVGFGSEKRLRSFASGLTAQESIGALRSNRGRLNRGPFADR